MQADGRIVEIYFWESQGIFIRIRGKAAGGGKELYVENLNLRPL